MTCVKTRGDVRFRLRPMAPSLHPCTRRRLCAWLAGALLLVQWLVAAHACPLLPVEVQGSPAAMHAGAAPCHGEAAASDEALCKAHCAEGQQVPAQQLAVDTVAHLPGGFTVLTLPTLQQGGAARPPADTLHLGRPPGWPPLYLAHGVLRI